MTGAQNRHRCLKTRQWLHFIIPRWTGWSITRPSRTQTETLVLGQLCVQRHHSGQWAIVADWQARKMSPLFRLYKWRLATITHDRTLHFKASALPASLRLLYHLLYLLPVVFVVGAQRINTGEMPLRSKILANFFAAVLMGSGRQPVSEVIKL